MSVVVQVVGSLFILVAFALSQVSRLATGSRAYLLLNVLGSAVLCADACYGQQWGFVLLEGAWAVTSAAGLAHVLLARPDK